MKNTPDYHEGFQEGVIVGINTYEIKIRKKMRSIHARWVRNHKRQTHITMDDITFLAKKTIDELTD